VKNKLFAQFSWVLIGRVVAAILQAATVAVLARELGPHQFGTLAAVLGVIIWFQAVSDLGMSKLVVKERATSGSDSLVAGGLWVNSRSTILLGIILGIGFTGAGLTLDHNFLLMAPLAISAAGEKNADTWLGVAIADGDTHLNSINLVSRRSLALFGFLGMHYMGIETLFSYSIAAAFAALISVAFARRHVSGIVTSQRDSVSNVLASARPFWKNTLAVQLRNLDAGIVGMVTNAGVAGYYATASRLSGPLRMLPTSLAIVILPQAARTRNEPTPSIVRIVLLAGSAVGCIYISLIVTIPWLLPLVFGKAYLPAIVPLQIVLAGLVFAGFTSLFGAVLQGRGFPQEVATISVITTFYLLLALVVLTTAGGAVGAAAALATSFAIEAIALGVIFRFRILSKGEK
jgi:O-antigen/teichoic acid export membrane protein